MRENEPMGEAGSNTDPPQHPDWEEVRRLQLERERRRQAFEAEWPVMRAETRAAIELVKQQETLMVRRRCWLF